MSRGLVPVLPSTWQPSLKITNVFSLVKDKTMVASSESPEASTSQVSTSQTSAEQHSALNKALIQHIKMLNKRSQRQSSTNPRDKNRSCGDILLPHMCPVCKHRARWPSEIRQHMKNHSDEKPFCCPGCTYKSKWKWDVIKHMRRCCGGTGKDVIDNSKSISCNPRNVVLAIREEPSSNGETTPIYKKSACRASTLSDSTVAEARASTSQPHPVNGMVVKKEPNMSPQLKCEWCDVSFAHISTLYQHALSAHPKLLQHQEYENNINYNNFLSPTYNSMTVSQNSESSSSLINSLQDYSSQSGNQSNDVPLGQPKTQSKHSSHVTTVKNLFACQQCPFKSTSKDVLEYHQEFHAYKGQYRCDFCNFGIDHINLIYDHSALHDNLINNNNNNDDNDNNHNSINNNTFVSINNNDARNINSDHCTLHQHYDHRFKQKHSQVDTHFVRKSHRKVTIHSRFGGVEFRSKYHNQHCSKLKQAKNTGRVRYKCTQCPYHTNCKNNIIKHRKQHIINSKHKCSHCNYSAARLYLLKQHLKFHLDEPDEQGIDFHDILLDPFDENSIKSLQDKQ